ncbi:MAG: hypothetical protein J6J71_01365 [Prevotella sp.]|nr:hypothetical protein [Prevotella sp.]
MEDSEIKTITLMKVYQRLAKDPTVDVNDPENIIVALENEVDAYREKIRKLESVIERLHDQQITTKDEAATLEAVQDNTVGEIIKALSDNGFNNISINIYKTKEE